MSGLEEEREIRGTLLRDQADHRLDLLPPPPQAASPSVSVPKRLARFRLLRRAAVVPGCGPRSGLSHVRELWRFPGAWTSSDRFAAQWKTVRSYYKRFMVRMDTIARCIPRRLTGMQIWNGKTCALVTRRMPSNRNHHTRQTRPNKKHRKLPRNRPRRKTKKNGKTRYRRARNMTENTTTQLWRSCAKWESI